MKPITLYYVFSTIPQVLGVVAALTVAFTHFRIQNLREHLIGHGRSVENRWGQTGYGLPGQLDENQKLMRLRDALDRKSISEVKDVILRLRDFEASEGITRDDRPTGLQSLYDRFCMTEKLIKNLRAWTVGTITISFVSIIASVASLAFTDLILASPWPALSTVILALNVFLMIVSLVLALILVRMGLSESVKDLTSWEAE